MGYTHTHTPLDGMRWNETECVYEGAITFLRDCSIYVAKKLLLLFSTWEKKNKRIFFPLHLLSLIFFIFYFFNILLLLFVYLYIYIGFMSHLVPACLFFYCPLSLYLFFSISTTLSWWFLISVREAKTGFLISQSEQLFIPPLLDTGARLGQISASGSRR